MKDSLRGVRARTGAGFTLLEGLIALAVLSIVTSLGIPPLLKGIHRLKLEGFARETGILVQRAKSESIRHNFQTVVRLDVAGGQVMAFADVDGPAVGSAPDGIFNPIAGETHRTTDYEIGRYSRPSGVDFEAPSGDPVDRTSGLTTIAGEQVALILPTGGIQNAGSFRIADARNNYIEVRIAPQATARVVVRKWDDVDAVWRVHREDGKKWIWS